MFGFEMMKDGDWSGNRPRELGEAADRASSARRNEQIWLNGFETKKEQSGEPELSADAVAEAERIRVPSPEEMSVLLAECQRIPSLAERLQALQEVDKAFFQRARQLLDLKSQPNYPRVDLVTEKYYAYLRILGTIGKRITNLKSDIQREQSVQEVQTGHTRNILAKIDVAEREIFPFYDRAKEQVVGIQHIRSMLETLLRQAEVSTPGQKSIYEQEVVPGTPLGIEGSDREMVPIIEEDIRRLQEQITLLSKKLVEAKQKEDAEGAEAIQKTIDSLQAQMSTLIEGNTKYGLPPTSSVRK